ncbi:hypothetical protein JCM6882_001307 [Rhodosporidiobolus microsporus]
MAAPPSPSASRGTYDRLKRIVDEFNTRLARSDNETYAAYLAAEDERKALLRASQQPSHHAIAALDRRLRLLKFQLERDGGWEEVESRERLVKAFEDGEKAELAAALLSAAHTQSLLSTRVSALEGHLADPTVASRRRRLVSRTAAERYATLKREHEELKGEVEREGERVRGMKWELSELGLLRHRLFHPSPSSHDGSGGEQQSFPSSPTRLDAYALGRRMGYRAAGRYWGVRVVGGY